MATPTVAGFKARYTAFAAAPTDLVQVTLDDAMARTDATTFGTHYERAVYLRCADLMAKTPEGQKMRLVLASGKSIYWDDLRAIIRRCTLGIGRNA